jgi:cysteinyl-tRNA synthetase
MLAERAQGADPNSRPAREAAERIATFERDFGLSLDDDLNISNAMAALFAFVTDIYRSEPNGNDAMHLLRSLDRADHITGVLNRDAGKAGLISAAELAESAQEKMDGEQLQALLSQPISPAQIKRLAQARHGARQQKNWATADAIRDHLKQAGVQFEDIPEGVRFRLP